MNWNLVFQLSLFGLARGFGTVFVIPSNIEPAFLVSGIIIGILAVVAARFVSRPAVAPVRCTRKRAS